MTTIDRFERIDASFARMEQMLIDMIRAKNPNYICPLPPLPHIVQVLPTHKPAPLHPNPAPFSATTATPQDAPLPASLPISSTPSQTENEATQVQQPHEVPPKHLPPAAIAPLHNVQRKDSPADTQETPYFHIPQAASFHFNLAAPPIHRFISATCSESKTKPNPIHFFQQPDVYQSHRSELDHRPLRHLSINGKLIQTAPFISPVMIKTSVLSSAKIPEANPLSFHGFGHVIREEIPPKPPPIRLVQTRGRVFLEEGVNGVEDEEEHLGRGKNSNLHIIWEVLGCTLSNLSYF